jgi:DNA-binding Xre family transcriptional regulator
MLKFSFDRIFKAKGIDKPYSYLTKIGFSENFATKVKNDKIKSIGLKQLERFCINFRCTPNELFDWHPDKDLFIDADHPLHTITKSERVIDMMNILHSLELDEIGEIEGVINDKLKARKDNAE